MKLVSAIVKPFKLPEIRDALTALGVQGMTVTPVKGFGRQKGHTEIYRGAEYAVMYVPKVRIDVVIGDTEQNKIVAAIRDAAENGRIRRWQDLRLSDRSRDAHPDRRDRRSGPVTDELRDA